MAGKKNRKKAEQANEKVLETVREEALQETQPSPAEEADKEEQTEKKKKSRSTKKKTKKQKEEPADVPAPEEEKEEPAEAAETEEVAPAEPYEKYLYRWVPSPDDLKKPASSRKTLFAAAIFCLVGLLALGVAVYFYVASLNNLPAQEEDEDGAVLVSVAPKMPEDALTVQEMVERVKPSVVGIQVKNKDNTETVASGVIVSDKGYIITNRHVVAGASSITVHLANGENYIGSVIGSDDFSDISVLRIRDAENLVAAELGDSALVRQGDWVIAVGTPNSLEFSASATLGIVSGTDRRVQMQTNTSTPKIFTVIQTDAAINHGNSGGPLVNVYGQVIGINSMKLSTDKYESIGFALPINGVIAIANQIIDEGRVSERPEEDFVVGGTIFGASFEYFSSIAAQEASLEAGAYVKTVEKGGPAEAAGIKMGDIITVFDGKGVTGLSVITDTLSEKSAGDVVKVQIYRDRTTHTVEVTLAAYQG